MRVVEVRSRTISMTLIHFPVSRLKQRLVLAIRCTLFDSCLCFFHHDVCYCEFVSVSLSITLVRPVSISGRIKRGIGDTIFFTEGETWSP